MLKPTPDSLPRWLNSRLVPRVGMGLCVMLALVALLFVRYAFKDLARDELNITRVFARVLQAHADHTLLSSTVVLRSLEKASQGSGPLSDAQREALSQSLAQPLNMLPFVRSLSLLDEHGQVLASSNPANLGAPIALALIKQGAKTSVDWLGTLQAGRDLVDLDSRNGRSMPAYTGRKQLLLQVHLLRANASTGQEARYLVATLNPDYFSNHYQEQLGAGPHRAALLSQDGVLLASSLGPPLPGTSFNSHMVFQQFLPGIEQSSYTAQGLSGVEVQGSFRALRSTPWVVVVEHPCDAIWQELRGTLIWTLVFTLGGMTVIAVLSTAAYRSLRSHEESTRALVTVHAQMAENERNQRLLIESVQELMFRTDAEGRLRFVNRQWFHGASQDVPVLGSLFTDFVDPHDQALARSLFKPSVTTPEPSGDEPVSTSSPAARPPALLRLRDNGSAVQRVLEVSVAPVVSAEQQLVGFAGFAIDVTDRELARRQHMDQLEFTARLIEVCPFPIFAKDWQGRYLMVNKAWCNMVGWPVEQVLGKTLNELRPAGDFSNTLEKDEELRKTGGTLIYEERVHFPNGSWHDLMVSKTLFSNAKGEPVGVIGSMMDITDFREVERHTREARDAAERANAAKGEFLANVSHELRTPLQSILGFAQVGRKRSQESPGLSRMFSDIELAGQRMLHLVNNLLDLSRLETSVGSFKLQPGDVRPLLQDVVQELSHLAESRHLSLRLELPNSPCPALMDGFRLQQVFRNILVNALRYAPAHSEVELRCSHSAEGCKVEVRDHGPGIPPEEFESIFAPFVQSSMNQTGTGGTGLGLAISRKIIHVHGGAIQAHNHPTGGAVFEVRLPPVA